MMKRLRFGLRTQLVLAMIASIIVTVSVAIALGSLTEYWYEQRFLEGLSAEAIKANEQVENFKLPGNEDAVRELLAKLKAVQGEVEFINNAVSVIVAVISVLLNSLIAIFLARRIGQPLEAVSVAAMQVAGGDLSARADGGRSGSGETAHLIENFNAMASSLERFQRQSVESSAAIAHELRTPLAILRGRLQGMLDGIFKRESRDIELLIAQVESLTQIVNDLSIVSLSTAGRLTIIRESIDLGTEIDMLLKAVRPDLEAAGFYVGVDLNPCPVDADPNRMRQATLALIENARIHADSGRSMLIETLIDAGDAVIRVSDRGPGLPAGHAQRLFEPFWRSDASRNRTSGGSGLGLSVVASIIAAHQGSVHASPRKGGGAAFEMRIPLAIATQNELG